MEGGAGYKTHLATNKCQVVLSLFVVGRELVYLRFLSLDLICLLFGCRCLYTSAISPTGDNSC